MKHKERESGPVNIRRLESDKELEADQVGKLEPDEVELVGTWESEESRIVEDPNTKRINWLTENYLHKVSTDESGWNTLYQDPEDKRYWELIFPNSQMQGGGAPSLINLSEEEARSKYSNL